MCGHHSLQQCPSSWLLGGEFYKLGGGDFITGSRVQKYLGTFQASGYSDIMGCGNPFGSVIRAQSKVNIKHLQRARHKILKDKAVNTRDMVQCLLSFHSNKDIEGSRMMLCSSLLWGISGLTGAQRRNYDQEYSELSWGRRVEAKARRKNGSWLSDVVRTEWEIATSHGVTHGDLQCALQLRTFSLCPWLQLASLFPTPIRQGRLLVSGPSCLVQDQKSIRGNCGPWWTYFLLSMKGLLWRGQFGHSTAKEQGWNLHCALAPNFLLFSPKCLQTNKTLRCDARCHRRLAFHVENVPQTLSPHHVQLPLWTQLPPDLFLWWPTALARWWVTELHFPESSDNCEFFTEQRNMTHWIQSKNIFFLWKKKI